MSTIAAKKFSPVQRLLSLMIPSLPNVIKFISEICQNSEREDNIDELVYLAANLMKTWHLRLAEFSIPAVWRMKPELKNSLKNKDGCKQLVLLQRINFWSAQKHGWSHVKVKIAQLLRIFVFLSPLSQNFIEFQSRIFQFSEMNWISFQLLT